MKKKGQQYEPYAYVPLNAKDYTKKNRSNAVKKMGSVVRGKRKRGNVNLENKWNTNTSIFLIYIAKT